jgi:two-component system, response regulator YesN
MLKHHQHLFYRYLVSYVVVLAVPIVMISAYFYTVVVNNLRDEEIANYYNAVTQARTQLDSRLEDIKNISVQVSVTPLITQLPDNGYQLKEELKKYQAVNQLSHEIILYLHGQDRLYSSYSSYTLATFANGIYRFSDWDSDSLYTDLNTLRTPRIRPAGQVAPSNAPTERLITYMLPFPANSREPYGTMLFMLKESAFRQALRNAIHEEDFNAIVVDRDRNIITTLAPRDYMDSAEFRSLLAETNLNGTRMVRMSGEEYIVVYSASVSTPLSYIFVIPSAVVMDKVSDVQQKMLYMLVLVLSAGAVIIYWLMHVNYNPISELVKIAARGLSMSRPMTELDTIRTAIRRMEETTSLLRHEVAVSQPIVREHTIVQLLNGAIGASADLGHLTEGQQPGLSPSIFTVVKLVLYPPAGHGLPSLRDLLSDLRAKLPASVTEFGSYWPDGKTLIIILETERSRETLIEEQFTVLYHYLCVRWGVDMVVGIGSSYEDMGGITTSYFESSTAADYLAIKGLRGVRHFVQIDFVNSIVQWYPERLMESLEWYLQQWDIEKMEVTLREIADKIKREDTPIYLVKCLCFNILNMLIRQIYQVKREMPHLREEFYDIVSLTQFETIDGLIDEIMRISRVVVNSLQASEPESEPALEERIMDYVKMHYGDANFTIHSVADRFTITPAYLRRVFKKKTGITLSEYVELLRMQHASQLLKESDESLSEIVYKIGYLNVSSFIRKFRQETGMTPGEYRSRHRA